MIAKDNELYLCKDGKLVKIEKPKDGFGKTILHWQDGKPILIETNYTQKIK